LPAVPRETQISDIAHRREREHHRSHRANHGLSHDFARERSLHSGAAVRFRELRRILQPFAVAGIPVMAAGCVEAVIDDDCVDTVERSYELSTPAPPALQLKIDRCRIDVDACTDLCREAMELNNVPMTAPTACKVVFLDSTVHVDVSFEVSSDGEDCPIDTVPPGPVFLTDASGLFDGPQVRGLSARTFDSLSDSLSGSRTGGRTCHA
jgi:hypothetical protein